MVQAKSFKGKKHGDHPLERVIQLFIIAHESPRTLKWASASGPESDVSRSARKDQDFKIVEL